MPLTKMPWWTLLVTLTLLSTAKASNIGNTRQDIVHEDDGGYKGLLIAIDENIPEDRNIITNIQALMWEMSNFMITATNTKKYLANYTILIPATWSHDPSWSAVAGESYDRARVVVADGIGKEPDRPYTKQPGGCGDEGDYIHLTPGFILGSAEQFPYKEKTLVHEWAHLKWGMLDEVADEDPYKWYSYKRRIYPTRCSRALAGTMRDETRPEFNFGCFISSTGRPSESCKFVADTKTTSRASIMYEYELASVISFCDNGEGLAQDLLHDPSSPNNLNRRCEQSAWDLLRSHEDFIIDTADVERENLEPSFVIVHDYDSEVAETTTTTTTTTTTLPDVAPTTTTAAPTTTTPFVEEVPRSPDIVCLVLDVSGSMRVQNRISIMGSAVANYLRNFLDVGTTVGIVKFSSRGIVLADMVTIIDDTTRDQLVNVIPTTTGGGTSIGAGITKCAEILSSYAGDNVANTRMFVLSDGQESVSPYVATTLPAVLALGITIDTIAYSQNADPILGSMAALSGGYSFYFSGSKVSTAMQDALLATVERRRNKDSPVTLLSQGLTVPAGANYTDTTAFDISIGRDTKLVFTYYNYLDVYVTAPSGNNVKMTRDTNFKLISVQIEGIVTGVVTFTLDNTQSNLNEDVVISVTSRTGVPGQDPITASARMSSSYIAFNGQSTVGIFADVFRGLNPVSGVNVSAIFERPDSTELNIRLVDTGLGVDAKVSDGVYSGTVMSYHLTDNGFYSLKVDVNGYGELAADTFQVGGKRKKRAVSTGPLSRVASGGMFQVENYDAAVALQDNFAPSKIKDLQVVEAIYGTDYFTIGWSAPGDDLDYGTASGYEMSVWYESHSNKTTNDTLLVPDAIVQTNWTTLLVPAGEFVTLTIVVGTLNASFFGVNETEVGEIDTYFFRLRAYDDVNNTGSWSNEISASFVNPADYAGEVRVTTVPQPSTTPIPSSPPQGPSTAVIIAISVAASVCFVALVVGVLVAVFVCCKKKAKVEPDQEKFTTSPNRSATPSPPLTTVG